MSILGSIFRLTRWVFFLLCFALLALTLICNLPDETNAWSVATRKMLWLTSTLVHMMVLPADKYLIHLKAWSHISKNTKKDDPQALIDALDAYGWKGNFMVSMGDRKSVFLDRAMEKCERDLKSPEGGHGPGLQIAVELGSFLGYSTVRIAHNLVKNGGRNNSTLISVDPDSLAHVVSLAMVDHAGLRDKVDFRLDYSYNVFRQLKKEGKQIDFLLLDHEKSVYLSDLKLALELGLLHRNSIIVADNIILPGAPDLKKFVTERTDLFETKVERSTVEYTEWEDEVTISQCIGCPRKGEKDSWCKTCDPGKTTNAEGRSEL